jgi:hypothetical protein
MKCTANISHIGGEKMKGRKRKLKEADLKGKLGINDDEIDLAAIDGWVDEEGEESGNSEMLSFRVDEAVMKQLKEMAEKLGIGHTILARELLNDGLKRLAVISDNDGE